MKFKYAVIIFNILIAFLLAALVCVPLAAFGRDFALTIWQASWPLALLLCVALIVLNIYFLLNRRLFWLLEREDWPALVDYLEQRVVHEGDLSPRKVQILINSYLVMGDSAGVTRLENKVAAAKPALLDENALVFGTARILGGDSAGAADFLRARLTSKKAQENQWLRWYYAFALVLCSAFDQAEAEMRALAAASTDVLIAGLSAYFLSGVLLKHSSGKQECRSIAEEGRQRVRQALVNIGGWKKEAAKFETEVYVAVIRKYIDEAGAWIF